MTKADQNLRVIENFILHITHCDGADEGFYQEIVFTPALLYQMAKEYIDEDHVDGRENKENNKLL